ncbi:hypothetical protein G6F65_019220 [Rhizopus arrhizus]|nr:hypothetical protein G6F65_019220 [Rhizopus arrhizus]
MPDFTPYADFAAAASAAGRGARAWSAHAGLIPAAPAAISPVVSPVVFAIVSAVVSPPASPPAGVVSGVHPPLAVVVG